MSTAAIRADKRRRKRLERAIARIEYSLDRGYISAAIGDDVRRVIAAVRESAAS